MNYIHQYNNRYNRYRHNKHNGEQDNHDTYNKCIICYRSRNEHKNYISHQFIGFNDKICKRCNGLGRDHKLWATHGSKRHKYTGIGILLQRDVKYYNYCKIC